jgi:uncharacterized flavoprotein (TIGR03862 family)
MKIVIVGAGPAGLMAAETAARGGAQVTVFDRMPSAGRKFLMAGRGGLNLTHSENLEWFLGRYREARPRLRNAIEAFPPDRLRAWADELGQETFVGTSGRVFPKAMKASPLLRTWLRRLDGMGVRFALRHDWTGWTDNGDPAFDTPDGVVTEKAGAVVLALGGASWPKLGSDGTWSGRFENEGIAVAPLRPANSGFVAPWSDVFRQRFAGQPVKRVALTFGSRTVRGEFIVTSTGVEGGAVYALSQELRDSIEASHVATLRVDLLPETNEQTLASRVGQPRGKQSLSSFLRKATSLPPVAIGLLQEATAGKLAAMPARDMAALIKSVPVKLTSVNPVARAISTAGGIAFDEIDETFMLKKKPGVFVAGEMLDWEAPTGGYLLQACFATGAAAGKGALDWAKRAKS